MSPPPSPSLEARVAHGLPLIFVSPHPDDVVFSSGAAIALAVRAGREVTVVTVFSGGPEAAERRREDAAAVRRLGATLLDLGLPEAPVRDRRLRAVSRLFAPLGSDDASLALVETVRARIEGLPAGAIVGPLGVGRHADHQVVHAACRLLAPGRDLSFYEDLPYAFCPRLTDARLEELGRPSSSTAPAGLRRPRESGGTSTANGTSGTNATNRANAGSAASVTGGRARLYASIFGFWFHQPVLAEMAPGPLLPVAAALVASAVSRRAPRSAAPLTWCEERIDISGGLDAWITAVSAYASQWPRFYRSLPAWRAALAAHARRAGSSVAVERRYRCDPVSTVAAAYNRAP